MANKEEIKEEVVPNQEAENQTESQETVENSGEEASETGEEQLKEKTPEDRIAELEKEVTDYKDQYLRKSADFENYRKRMLKEKQEAFDYANTNLLTDLIAILDDFDRALSATSTEGTNPVVDGIKMINKQMKGLLEAKYNLSSYGEKGDVFDHNKHEAIGKNEGPVSEPVCAEVYLKGYMLKDRVIRHAKVMVTMPDGTQECKNEAEDASK